MSDRGAATASWSSASGRGCGADDRDRGSDHPVDRDRDRASDPGPSANASEIGGGVDHDNPSLLRAAVKREWRVSCVEVEEEEDVRRRRDVG